MHPQPVEKKVRPASKRKVEPQPAKEVKSKAASKQIAQKSAQPSRGRGEPAAPPKECITPSPSTSQLRSAGGKNSTTIKPCHLSDVNASSSTCYIEPRADRSDIESTQNLRIRHDTELAKCSQPSQVISKPLDPRIPNLDVIRRAAVIKQKGMEFNVILTWTRHHKKIVERYMRTKYLFEPSKMGWLDLGKCFTSACELGEPPEITVRLKIWAGEVKLIQEEVNRIAHRFRKFYKLRLYTDHFNWMTPEAQYLLLQEIRRQMLVEPFQLCEDSNQNIYRFLEVYWEVFPKPKFFRSAAFKDLRLLVARGHEELRIPQIDTVGLCDQLFESRIDGHCQAAAINDLNLRAQFSAMILTLYGFGEYMAVRWKDTNKTEYKTTQERTNDILWRVQSISRETRIISEAYLRLVVKISINNQLSWRPPKARLSHISGARYLSTIQITSIKLASSRAVQETTVGAQPIALPLEHLGQSLKDAWDPASDDGNLVVGALDVPAEYSHILAQPHDRQSVNQSRHNNHQCTKVHLTLNPIRNSTSFVEENFDQYTHRGARSSLSYQIPESKLGEAMLASRSTPAAYWRYSLYENERGEKVKVHYCQSKETSERTAQLFLDKEVIGFDIEWKPQAQTTDGIRKNVSLIQIASEERIALFHVARYAMGETADDLLAPTLKKIMESNAITKVGVSIKSDCTRMQKFLGINSRGIFELSHLYKLIKYSAGDIKKIDKKLVALAQQVEEHLQLPLWKGEIRSSDWSKSQSLSYEQIEYAASDSYAGFQLYHMLERKREHLTPMPPRPEHAELNLPIRLAHGQTVTTTDDLQDTNKGGTDDRELPTPVIEKVARLSLDTSLANVKSKQRPNKHSRLTESLLTAPQVAMADEWVREWRSTRSPGSQSQSPAAFLRAYSLWHHQEYDVVEAARLLRNPPLQISTVCHYILRAIRIDKLPFEEERLNSVLAHVPNAAIRGRYQLSRRQIG